MSEKGGDNKFLRRLAIDLSLYANIIITIAKLIAYVRTLSLSVLAALVDSVLDIASQLVLNYTERHSSMQRSSAFYPAGASRLEPIGVLTCAALMGMASFEVLKESAETLFYHSEKGTALDGVNLASFWSMVAIIFVKLGLLVLCQRADHNYLRDHDDSQAGGGGQNNNNKMSGRQSVRVADPTLEALAQDHWNDALSNGVAAVALCFVLIDDRWWFLDPIGAIIISIYIIHSWYATGKEQIEQLTGKAAPEELIEELQELASHFDERLIVDVCRAYHFGPKFLVELEIVMPRETLLFESHDLGMDLQYEIESRDEVERCFVHIDYERRPYDEHVVSKVPELREKLRASAKKLNMAHSV